MNGDETPEVEHLEDDELDDEDEGPWTESVRAKWAMDGATTLSQAADLLRAHAAWLEELERDGWQLIEPIEDDWAFIAHPDPDKRLSTAVVDQPDDPPRPPRGN